MGQRRIQVAVAAVAAVATATVGAVVLSSPAEAATLTFTAVADTYAQSDTPTTNYGTSSQVVVDNSPVRYTYLKFTVSGVTGTVTGAKLRLRTIGGNSGSSNGGTYKTVSDSSWTETGLNWNNKPALGTTLGSVGSISKNTWYEVDVTGAISGNGTFTIGGMSTSTDGAYYSTRETSYAPQLVLTTSGSPSPSPTTAGPTASPTQPPQGDPVLVGAGDIADSGSGDSATAALINGIAGTVFTAGDNVYSNGTAGEFTSYYQPTWGQFKARTRPAPGNHDYNTSGATGYYNYFGSLAGPSGQGYYSYDLGSWHIISLNSEVSMSAGSAQETWLRNDLAAHPTSCTFAYWHKPLYTSGANHAPETATRPLFQALYDYNADVVVTGHNHQYERFAPMNANGALDSTRGIRSFVAGMGGAGHYSFGTIQANSLARNSDTWGVLKFTLHAGSYDWQFVPEAGKTYSDSGTGTCH